MPVMEQEDQISFDLFLANSAHSGWKSTEMRTLPASSIQHLVGFWVNQPIWFNSFMPPLHFLSPPLADDSTTWTFHTAFDDSHLFHSPIDLLRFQLCLWLLPLGEPSGSGQM